MNLTYPFTETVKTNSKKKKQDLVHGTFCGNHNHREISIRITTRADF